MLLLISDFGNGNCGVGDSAARWVRSCLLDADTVDPVRTNPRAVYQFARRARAQGRLALAIYPTRSSTMRPAFLIGLIATRLAGCELVLHLHESKRLRSIHRLYVVALCLCATERIICSTKSDRDYLQRRLAIRIGRRRAVVKSCPPPNGTAPESRPVVRPPAAGLPVGRPIVVGVFGIPRRDKGLDMLPRFLAALAHDVERVELIGAGWNGQLATPEMRALQRLYPLVCRGFVPRDQLAAVVSEWDCAVATFSDGASDRRLSLRTPLSYGVPTISPPPVAAEDLTLRPPHLILIQPDTPPRTVHVPPRSQLGVDWVMHYEDAVCQRLAALVAGSDRGAAPYQDGRRLGESARGSLDCGYDAEQQVDAEMARPLVRGDRLTDEIGR